jgi:hypothetical protein
VSDDLRANYAESVRQASAERAEDRRAVLAARNAPTVSRQAQRDELATLAEVGPPPNVAELYARLISVAAERAQLYGAQLAAAYAEVGDKALSRTTYLVDQHTGELVESGEQITALVKLEMDERKTLERLIVQGARLGLERRAVEAIARQGSVLVSALRRFAEAMGLDFNDPTVRRQLQAALLAAREQAEREDGQA